MSPEPLFTRAFVLCALANLFQGIAFNLFLHLPGFLDGLGAGPVLIGQLHATAAIAAIGARPRVGRAMDTRGRRGVILLGNALNVAVTGGYLLVDAVGPLLVAVRVVHGLAEALLFTSLFTYAADWVPEGRRTQGLALFGISGMLPISLGGLLGDWALAAGGYDALFLLALALSVVAFGLSLPLRDRESAPGPEGAQREEPAGFRGVLSQRGLVPLWWVGAVFTTAITAVFAFLKLFVLERGVGSVGGFFTAYAATALLLRIGAGWLPDRVGPKRVLFPSLGALALGIVVLGLARSDEAVWVSGVLCGAGHGYAFPILFSLVVSRARAADRGTAMAIYTGLFDLGVLVGGPAFGWVLERLGFTAMFHWAAGLVIVGSASYAWLDRGRR